MTLGHAGSWIAGALAPLAIVLLGTLPLEAAAGATGAATQVTPPNPPTGLIAPSIVGNVVTLQWLASDDGVIPTGYVIEGGTQPGEVLAEIPTNSSRPAYVFGAPSGVFYVRVRALSGTLRSEPSNEIRIGVNAAVPPSAPQGLAGLVNGSHIDLVWRNTQEGGVPARMEVDVTGSAVTTLAIPAGEQFSFPGVPSGTYTLAVRAVNAFGSSGASNTVTLAFPGPCSGVPAPPEAFGIYKAGVRLFTYWAPASSGPAATSFALTVSGGFNGEFATTARSLSGSVSPGTYALSVAGINACGRGPATTVQHVTVP